jgi:hypothetical protein
VASGVVFTLTTADRRNARLAVQPNIAEIASRVAGRAAAGTPRRTGRMAGSWEVRPGYSDPGTSVVVNTAPYARYVEYGTRRTRAYAPLGRALAGR